MSKPERQTTPWFDCELTMAVIDPAGDATLRKVLAYDLEQPESRPEISFGEVEFSTSGPDY